MCIFNETKNIFINMCVCVSVCNVCIYTVNPLPTEKQIFYGPGLTHTELVMILYSIAVICIFAALKVA